MILPGTLSVLLLLAPQQSGPVVQTQQVFGAQRPPRDASLDKKGTGVIRGRVTSAEGRPLRRVQVSVSGEGIEPKTASTNGLGRFEIRDLPAGRYNLSATRAGYLRMAYGQSRPGEPGRPIELADAQVLERVDVVLPRTAIIAGRVLDEAGEPLAGANVYPLQLRYWQGKRRVLPMAATRSDDTGQYRISGLAPGEYYVQASSQEKWETDPPEKQMMGFLPTFYPSAPNVGEAQRIRVRVGQEAVADIGLLPGKLVKVSGTATNSLGQPLVGESVSLGLEIRGENFMTMMGGIQSAKVAGDGSFIITGVPPGEYTINLRTQTREGVAEAAKAMINALNGDVEGVSIVTMPASSVAGRVTLEPGAALPSDFSLTRMTVRPQAVNPDAGVSMIGFMPDGGKLREDGSFEIKGVSGGAFRLSIAPLPDGWAVRGVDLNGRDVTAAGIESQGQPIEGITLTLTNRFPVLSGSLRDEKGNPATSATAILFPDDPSLWIEDLRNVRTARTDQSGVFTIKAIRPGEYLAIALPTVQNNQWNDPEFLEQLRSSAKRITLGDGESKQIELTVKSIEQ